MLLDSLIGFIIAIAILVTIHEFGHFWVARKLGIKVLRFSIGFGRPLWKKTARDGTEYVIAMIPLGGYVKMLDRRETEVPPEHLAWEFNQKPLWVRSAVVAAGPLFNFILAILLLWFIYMIGENGLRPWVGEVEPQSIAEQIGFQAGDEIIAINEQSTQTWSQVLYRWAAASASGQDILFQVRDEQNKLKTLNLPYDWIGDLAEIKKPLQKIGLKMKLPRVPATIAEVLPDSPAAQAGLQAGDVVITADGQPINHWQDWVKMIQAKPNQIMQIEVQRGNERLSLSLIPQAVEQNGQLIGRIGAIHQNDPDLWQDYIRYERYGPVEAFKKAMQQTWEISWLTLKVLGRVISGEASLKNLGGPVTMADVAGQALNAGSMAFIKLLALISIGLGVFNLLPIPMLDGGHLFYFAVEAIRGQPPSEQFILRTQQFGLALLLSLMVLVLYQDILRLME